MSGIFDNEDYPLHFALSSFAGWIEEDFESMIAGNQGTPPLVNIASVLRSERADFGCRRIAVGDTVYRLDVTGVVGYVLCLFGSYPDSESIYASVTWENNNTWDWPVVVSISNLRKVIK